MSFKPKAQFFGDSYLQGLDFRVDELDHIARLKIDQVIMVIAVSGLVTCATVTELVLLQYSRLLEQFHRPVDCGDGNPGVICACAAMELLDVRVIFGLIKYGGNDPALIGHPQLLRFASFQDRLAHIDFLCLGSRECQIESDSSQWSEFAP